MNAQNGVINRGRRRRRIWPKHARQAANRKLHMIYRIMVAIQRYLEIRFFAHRNGLRPTSSNGKVSARGRIPFESGNRSSDRVYVKTFACQLNAEGVVRMARIVDNQHDRTDRISGSDIFSMAQRYWNQSDGLPERPTGRLTQRIVLRLVPHRRWRCAPINSDDTAAGVAAVYHLRDRRSGPGPCPQHDAPGTLANGADQKVVHVKTQVVRGKLGKLSLPYTQ